VKNVIVITGASSGFGALAARALARAGHTVYASMRDTTGRNAPQVEEARRSSSRHITSFPPTVDGNSTDPSRPMSLRTRCSLVAED